MIITLDLCLRYGDFSLIEGLNLHIQKGEFVFICGQAAAGKTSLLRVFALLRLPSEGRVIIDGADVTNINKFSLTEYRRTLGVIFQEDVLLERRTLAENIAISLELAEWRAADARREANEYLKEIGLLGKADLFPTHISKNEEQLLKICRALARRPKIVLADEPYEGLDWQSMAKAVNLFRKAHLRGSTIVIATHHVEFAEQAGKRSIMLDQSSLGLKAKAMVS
jgi:cell division transport system ATP-binding protein